MQSSYLDSANVHTGYQRARQPQPALELRSPRGCGQHTIDPTACDTVRTSVMWEGNGDPHNEWAGPVVRSQGFPGKRITLSLPCHE